MRSEAMYDKGLNDGWKQALQAMEVCLDQGHTILDQDDAPWIEVDIVRGWIQYLRHRGLEDVAYHD